MKTENGFTLIELFVALAVLATLLAVGIPSYRILVAGNAGTTETNRVLSSIQLARSEAVKRGDDVQVCGAQNGMSACKTAVTDWSEGWLVIPSASGSAPIRAYSASDSPDAVTVSGVDAIEFNGMGQLTGGSPATVDVALDCPRTGTQSGSVAIALTGHAQADGPSCN